MPTPTMQPVEGGATLQQQVTLRARIEQLETTADAVEFVTQGSPSYKVKIPLTHPNYNAHYTLLLTAAFNGYMVDLVVQKSALSTPQLPLPYSLISATVKWTKFSTAPNA